MDELNEYDLQAFRFLEDTCTTFTIKFLYKGKYFPDDQEERDIYLFTLKNPRGEYISKFGDSIANTKRNEYRENWTIDTLAKKREAESLGIKTTPYCGGWRVKNYKELKRQAPRAYDVLACLTVFPSDTFENFCKEFGYDSEPLSKYTQVMRAYTQAMEEYEKLSAMFTPGELQNLSEIT